MTHDNAVAERRVLDLAQVSSYRGPLLTLFIGVATGGSGVHQTYPAWAPLFLPGSVLAGFDLPEDSQPQAFRDVLLAMRDNPAVRGAVITSHKLRLFHSCADLFDSTDTFVTLTHEVNSLSTADGIHAFARDPQSLDVVLDDTTGGRPVMCIGAGGSATALLLATGLDIPASLANAAAVPRSARNSRGHLTIIGRRARSLDALREVQVRAGISDDVVRYVLCENDAATSDVVRQQGSGCVIANSTGLGKLGPGSPLADGASFPADAVAWDFNYRGPLTFLEQATKAGIDAIDGWDYFVAGWSAGLAAIANLPITAGLLSEATVASAKYRPVR